ELILAGSGANDEDFDSGAGSINAELGHYLTDEVVVGLRQGVSFADFGDSAWNGATSIYGQYVFDLDRWRPFLGASLGYLYGDDTEETFIAGPEGGVKYYVKDDTFIYLRGAYEFLFEDADDADDSFDDGRWVYALGIGFNF